MGVMSKLIPPSRGAGVGNPGLKLNRVPRGQTKLHIHIHGVIQPAQIWQNTHFIADWSTLPTE